MSLRVLHYVDAVRLEAGGVVRAVLDLAEGLAAAGVEIVVATGDDADAPDEWRQGVAGKPRIERLDTAVTPLLAPRTAGPRLAELMAEVDLVHLHTPWDPFNPAVARVAGGAGRPYLLSVHGMLDDWCMALKPLKKRAYLSLAGRRLLESAWRLHFTAEAERDQGMRWAPAAEPLVLPLLMDTSPYETLPGPAPAREQFAALSSRSGPYLLFLSRVDPKKGIDMLIEAVAVLAAEGSAVRALIAGPGEPDYVDSLRELARRRGVEERIEFLGMVRGELKWSLYQACDAFVLPTHQENFGIVLVEAMACGLPTLTTEGVDIWRELQRCGARIVPIDSAAVVDGVRALLSDLEGARQTAASGRDEVLRWLDPERLQAEYVALYEQAVSETR